MELIAIYSSSLRFFFPRYIDCKCFYCMYCISVLPSIRTYLWVWVCCVGSLPAPCVSTILATERLLCAVVWDVCRASLGRRLKERAASHQPIGVTEGTRGGGVFPSFHTHSFLFVHFLLLLLPHTLFQENIWVSPFALFEFFSFFFFFGVCVPFFGVLLALCLFPSLFFFFSSSSSPLRLPYKFPRVIV